MDKEHLKQHLLDQVKGVPQDQIVQAMVAHFQYCSEHYGELTPEAKEVVDQYVRVLRETADEAIVQVRQEPDNPKRRQIIRLYRKLRGSHFEADFMLKGLMGEDANPLPLVTESRGVFLELAGTILDYLCDITEATLRPKDTAFLGLIYAAIEEANIAYFLATKSYAPQSMSHTRHILESIDLLELFRKDDSYLQQWTSEEWKDRKQVEAKAVRKLLGKDSFDPIYSLLSELGSHATFQYIQMKVRQRIVSQPSQGKPGKMQIGINLGGVPKDQEFHVIQAVVACLLATSSLLLTLVGIYEHLLSSDDVTRLNEAHTKLRVFLETHYDPICQEMGVEAMGPDTFAAKVNADASLPAPSDPTGLAYQPEGQTEPLGP